MEWTYKLTKWLDLSPLKGAVKSFLDQSSKACEAGDLAQMLDLAQSAHRLSIERHDNVGEAVALVFMGLAYLQASRFDQAHQALMWARRIFQRDPRWRSRLNEGIALYGLGLTCQLQSADASVEAIAYFENALELLHEVREKYWIAAEDDRVQAIVDMTHSLEGRVDAQLPRRYVEGNPLPTLTDKSASEESGLIAADPEAAGNEEFERGELGGVDIHPK